MSRVARRKKLTFAAAAVGFGWLVVEATLYAMTTLGVLPVDRRLSPWPFLGRDARYGLDVHGSPVFFGGTKRYVQRGLSEHPVKLDAEGFRVEDSARFDQPGHRIGFFGDSYTEGLQVADEDTFVRLFERELAGTIGFNFGVGGTGTYHQWLRYRTVADRVRLDHVVVCFLPQNDVLNNHEDLGKEFELPRAPYLTRPASGPWFPEERDSRRKWLLGASFLVRAFQHGPDVLFAPSGNPSGWQPFAAFRGRRTSWFGVFREPTTADWEQAWMATEEVIRGFAREAHDAGARFSLVIVAGSLQIEFDGGHGPAWTGEAEFSYPNRRLMAFCESEGLECHDSLPYFLKRKSDLESPWFAWETDGHYSELGHRTMADFLLSALKP